LVRPASSDLQWSDLDGNQRSLGLFRGAWKMAIIVSNKGIITQINTFTVPFGSQNDLLEVLREAVDCAQEEPGWISASLHRSLDGTRIVNYAQSESMDAAQMIISRLKREGFLDRNKAYGEAHPGLYEVVASYSR
jgi:quinol monooxygenase YgiN